VRGVDRLRAGDVRRGAVFAARENGQDKKGEERDGNPPPERMRGHGAS
jgi:hypothetical protein